MTFRTDINGLRAIAVIGVILFHFNEDLLPGGFIGVDVFFVISGFLMTKIIINGLNNKNFSLKTFYASRANRIIPPLAMLCFFLLIFGWFFLTPVDYRQVGNDVLNSMLFISNFIYAQEKSYFDISTSENWLLHTWSLSAEWQFYLIYPLLLLVIHKYCSLHKTKLLIMSLTLISFVTCIVWSNIAPTSSYFLLPTRAWEMLMGGVAFLYPLSKTKNHKLIPWLGIAMILASAIFISEEILWPSYLTLLPILGTYLIIVSNQKTPILDNKLMQKVGSWSYSIYLWHWLIVTIGLYFSIPNWMFIGLPLSVFLGYLSYRFIETRSKKTFIMNPVILVISLAAIGGGIHATDGAEFHYSKNVHLILDAGKKDSALMCNDGQADYIILGVSHAGAQLASLLTVIPKNKSMLSSISSGCLFIPYLDTKHRNIDACKNQVNHAYNKLLPQNKGANLLFIQRTNIFFTGYNPIESEKKEQHLRYVLKNDLDITNTKKMYIQTMCSLAKDYNVFVTKPTPEQLVNVPNFLIKNIILGMNSEPSISTSDYNQRNENTNGLFNQITKCGVRVLDPAPYLCSNGKCRIKKNGIPLYRDDDHLNDFGTQQLIPMFKNIIN